MSTEVHVLGFKDFRAFKVDSPDNNTMYLNLHTTQFCPCGQLLLLTY